MTANPHRRHLLGSCIAIGTASIAGCLSGESAENGGDSDDPDAANGDESVDGEATATALEDAVSNLEDVETEVESDDDEEDDFSRTRAENRLESASSDLEAAAASAASEQEPTVETLRAYADLLEDAIEYQVLSEQLGDRIETAQTLFDADRIEDARDELDAARDLVPDLEDRTDDLDAALGDLEDVQQFHDTDFEPATYYDVLERAEDAIDNRDAIGTLVDSMDRFYAGLETFLEGIVAHETGDLYQASRDYDDAASTFDETVADLEDAERDATGEIERQLIEMSCYARSLADGTGHFADGAVAELEGDYDTADLEYARGDEAFDRTCE